MTTEECYLCCGTDPPLWRPCRCKMHAHPECLQQLIAVPSHSTHCAVCRYPYNIETRTVCRVRGTHDRTSCAHVMVAYVGACSAWLLFVVFILQYLLTPLDNWTQFALMSIISCIATACVGGIVHVHILHRRATGHFCCVACTASERKLLPLCQRV